MNSPNGAGGLRLGRSGRMPLPLYAPLVLKTLASASIKSIGHPLVLKALANYLFYKPSELKAALYFNGFGPSQKVCYLSLIHI